MIPRASVACQPGMASCKACSAAHACVTLQDYVNAIAACLPEIAENPGIRHRLHRLVIETSLLMGCKAFGNPRVSPRFGCRQPAAGSNLCQPRDFFISIVLSSLLESHQTNLHIKAGEVQGQTQSMTDVADGSALSRFICTET